MRQHEHGPSRRALRATMTGMSRGRRATHPVTTTFGRHQKEKRMAELTVVLMKDHLTREHGWANTLGLDTMTDLNAAHEVARMNGSNCSGTYWTMTTGGLFGSELKATSAGDATKLAEAAGYVVLDVTDYDGNWVLVIAD